MSEFYEHDDSQHSLPVGECWVEAKVSDWLEPDFLRRQQLLRSDVATPISGGPESTPIPQEDDIKKL